MVGACGSYFSVTVIKIPQKGNLKGGRICFGSQLEEAVHRGTEVMRQELDKAGDNIVSTAMNQRTENAGTTWFSCFQTTLCICVHTCGDLNMIGPGRGTMMKCGLVGGSVPLWWWALRPFSELPRSQSSPGCS